jgi:hypothetical protein
LIPEHAFERVGDERGDLAVEQLAVRAFAFADLGGVARRAGRLRALRDGFGFRGLEFLELDGVVGFRLFRVDLGQAALSSGLVSWTSGAIHDSIGVPPTEVLIKPTGTPTSRWISRPKKYSVALKPPTLSGVQASHLPLA